MSFDCPLEESLFAVVHYNMQSFNASLKTGPLVSLWTLWPKVKLWILIFFFKKLFSGPLVSQDPSLYSLRMSQIQEKLKGLKKTCKHIFLRCLFLVVLFYEPFLTSGSNHWEIENSVLEGNETEIFRTLHFTKQTLGQCLIHLFKYQI